MARIFVLMGKSSTGKDTVYGILKNDNELDLKNIIMYTTRPKRAGELEGREYFFTDNDKEVELESRGKVIEVRAYDTVYGIWKYFTADDGQIDVNSDENYLIIGTLEVYESFVRYYGNEHIVPIYIEIDDKTRIHRALMREDMQENPKYAEMCRRFLADEKDFSEEKLLSAGIEKRYINGVLEECILEIKNDILDLIK